MKKLKMIVYWLFFIRLAVSCSATGFADDNMKYIGIIASPDNKSGLGLEYNNKNFYVHFNNKKKKIVGLDNKLKNIIERFDKLNLESVNEEGEINDSIGYFYHYYDGLKFILLFSKKNLKDNRRDFINWHKEFVSILTEFVDAQTESENSGEDKQEGVLKREDRGQS